MKTNNSAILNLVKVLGVANAVKSAIEKIASQTDESNLKQVSSDLANLIYDVENMVIPLDTRGTISLSDYYIHQCASLIRNALVIIKDLNKETEFWCYLGE
ncbi:hypothetical protein FHQ18_00395 [Deferribacter autotrophicus]|uniref:Uncharacterized protein n=1 Tax=Deferribacter autotrophicus TaxID=500465 RepID=A0A5A8F6E3_9BACT|nr:hypothetical protein [Deferribacter autotrophicus]KAA0259370.1 hypothetical protein FHQ18_00395 [Deferribacter autotrophicus]